jgi:hypothetical protein
MRTFAELILFALLPIFLAWRSGATLRIWHAHPVARKLQSGFDNRRQKRWTGENLC